MLAEEDIFSSSAPDFAKEDISRLVNTANELFESLKTSAARQTELKQSLGSSYGSESHNHIVHNATRYMDLHKFVDDTCSQIHVLLNERQKLICDLSDNIERKHLFHQVNCLVISSLYWLRIYVRETIGILPYLIDVSLNLHDIHNIVSSVDAVEKLIHSGSLKQCYVSATVNSNLCSSETTTECNLSVKKLPSHETSHSMATVYTLLLEPSASVTLLKALNSFADVRAQLTSNTLLAYIQNLLTPALSGSRSGANGKSHEVALEQRGKNTVDTARELDSYTLDLAKQFQMECSSLIEGEVNMAKVLIECFSQSTGFVQSLSKKSLRKTLQEDVVDSSHTQTFTDEHGIDQRKLAQTRPVTPSKNNRRMKGIIWGDAVDTGVRNRLEAVYSNWYFNRLKSVVLGRCLFAMHSRVPQPHLQGLPLLANWSLSWKKMRCSCDFLLNLLNKDMIEGSPQELLSLILFSALVRSYELQSNELIDKISMLTQEERISFVQEEDELALSCQSTIAIHIYKAANEVYNSDPNKLSGISLALYDQLSNLQISTFRSLLDFSRHLLSYRCGQFLARKSYPNFIAVLSDVEILIVNFRNIFGNMKHSADQPDSLRDASDSVELLFNILDEVEAIYHQYRVLFVERLNEDVTEFLNANMPTATANWRMRKTLSQQRSTLAIGLENGAGNEYMRFSVQPNQYSFSLFRSCLANYLGPLFKIVTERQVGISLGRINFASQLLFELVTSMFMRWLKYILDKRIKFSPMGARQLEADFQNVQNLIEQKLCMGNNQNGTEVRESLGEEERNSVMVREFRALPIVHQLRSIIYILLSKTADFNVSAFPSDGQGGTDLENDRLQSADSDPLVELKRHRKPRRRKRGGVAPLSSADSDQTPLSSRAYPIPYGAETWLALIDDWSSVTNGESNISRLFGINERNEHVGVACYHGCVPRRFWRSPRPV